MLKIIYKGKDLVKIKAEISKAFDFSGKFFPVKIAGVVVRVHENRADFEKRLRYKTAIWLVANASNHNEVDILSPLAMEKESNHDKSEFLPILKHEFTHLFICKLAKEKIIPMWLNEGLASYVAKQHQDEKRSIYIEESFCEKLGTSRGWNENVNYSAYSIASLFVYFLIKKYSFEKIKELITSLDKNYYFPSFKKIFLGVYGISIDEMEQLFVADINK